MKRKNEKQLKRQANHSVCIWLYITLTAAIKIRRKNAEEVLTRQFKAVKIIIMDCNKLIFAFLNGIQYLKCVKILMIFMTF